MDLVEQLYGKSVADMTEDELKLLTTIPYGYCQCGCGQVTARSNHTNTTIRKGQHFPYKRGHQNKGSNHPQWKGGVVVDPSGVVKTRALHHPRASNGYVLDHILKAEKALGKALPEYVEVHHVDGDPNNNGSFNLVICENHSYHSLLHMRKRAYDACGCASWRKCNYCKEYDDPNNLFISEKYTSVYHRRCREEYKAKVW